MKRHLSRALGGVLIGALTCVAIAGAQSSTTDPAVGAEDPYLNGIPKGATPYLAPGATKMGMRKGPHTYYDGGAVVVTDAAALLVAWDCSANRFCLYDGSNGTGFRAQISIAGAYAQLSQYSIDNAANSWRSTRSTGTYIDEHPNGGGWRICANPGQGNIPLASQNEASRVFIRLSGNC